MADRERGDRQRLEALDRTDERREPLPRLGRVLEDLHVHPGREDVALGAPDGRADVRALDLGDAVLQLVEGAGGEEVEVAVRKRDDADVAVALDR